jgi:ABC-type multidrug transport system ATPase subunit
MAEIVVNGLSFAYPNQRVFEDFDFCCLESLFFLAGPSGCGKTTLLKILAGFLPPSGVRILKVPERSKIVLQEDGLFPWLTVEQNLALAGVSARVLPSSPVASVVPFIEELLGKKAFELSFGQRRTVELFRVFAAGADLVCLDEPFNFLDTDRRSAFASCVNRLRDDGVSFAISTHYDEDSSLLDGPIFKFSSSLPVTALIPSVNLAGRHVE